MNKYLSLKPLAIGSLPHSDTGSAVMCAEKYFPEIPFWSQLSKVNPLEDMTVQFSENFPGLILNVKDRTFSFSSESEEFYGSIDEFYSDYCSVTDENDFSILDKYAISETFSSTFKPFLKYINENSPKYAKGQIVGPFTWGTMLKDDEDKLLFYDDMVRDVLVKFLSLKALWQVKMIKENSSSTTPIIFIDEPTVSQLGTSAFLTVKNDEVLNAFGEIVRVLHDNGALAAIHCCGKADWNLILKCSFDIINFDVFSFSKSILTFAPKIKEFIEMGGYVAFGIVPTLDSESLNNSTPESLFELLNSIIDEFVLRGLDREKLISHLMVTPTCGAGGLSVENAEKAMQYVKKISDMLRLKYEVNNDINAGSGR